MKPAPFKYIAARSAEEAVEQLSRHDGSARLLAGGQSLIPLLNLRMARPAALIDLATCAELAYIRRDGSWLAIGPMTLQSDAEHSALVADCCPLLTKALPYLGSPTIRNRGTIGGTLAHADRVAELPGVALALEAEFVAQGPNGSRIIGAKDFFVADLTNALKPDEMLREIRFPIAAAQTNKTAFVEANNRHHDLATVGVAVSLDMASSGRCQSARLVAIGVGPTPVRLAQAEAHLVATRDLRASDLDETSHVALQEVDPEGDFHASAEYRRLALRNLVKRGLSMALGMA